MFDICLLVGLSLAFNETIFAGEIHYARVPAEYWEHRLSMIRAMGMNGISVYIMWNHHEVAPGKWDFQTGNRNLPAFLGMAKRLNLSVFIRPGPYVCAEWDFGGFPTWLYTKYNLRVRDNNDYFMAESERYIIKVAQVIRPFLLPQGPIKLIQVENEYGGWGRDHGYMKALVELWHKHLGSNYEYYVVDHIEQLNNSWVDGLSVGINGYPTQANFSDARKWFPTAPTIFGGEIYPGWFTHWADAQFRHLSVPETVKMAEFFATTNRSFSLYMAHGGTNFGFSSGGDSIQGYVTSYDYDAPINEFGKNTPKYDALRSLFQKYATWDIPEVPPLPFPMAAIPSIRPAAWSTTNVMGSYFLVNSTNVGNQTTGPWSFEAYNLSHGAVVYKFKAPAGNNSVILHIADYAVVLISNGFRKTFNVHKDGWAPQVNFSCSQECTVEVLVESLGHVNVGYTMNNNRKGLIWTESSFQIDQMYLKLLPLEYEDVASLPRDLNTNAHGFFFKTGFELTQVTDTYLDLTGFRKGFVWVNGHNLGRHWSIGPQKRLYCPGAWLKKSNELVVLDFQTNQSAVITSTDHLEDRTSQQSS